MFCSCFVAVSWCACTGNWGGGGCGRGRGAYLIADFIPCVTCRAQAVRSGAFSVAVKVLLAGSDITLAIEVLIAFMDDVNRAKALAMKVRLLCSTGA